MSDGGLSSLAARLRAAAAHAGVVARGTEILAARMQVGLPAGTPCMGLDEAVQHHAKQAQVLADAHAFVLRCAAQPALLETLAALERGETVTLESAAGRRPVRAAAGAPSHATVQPPKPWSRVLDSMRPGHRKSSGPAAHASALSPASAEDHRSSPRCRDSHPSSRETVPSVTKVA
ncbi:hypothetical protein [Methylobacterium currus]|uniref:hypothetical protein n=1 Tax=Methylobacterium currus TaxID=2051553 RepID=UPI000F4F7E8B|nr:hypothetical protein [Methylobacterium currus]